MITIQESKAGFESLFNQERWTLDELRVAAGVLIDRYGLKEKGWSFTIDKSKAIKNRLGQCRRVGMEIAITQWYAELNTRELVEDTLRHEIAHALVGTWNGHNDVWKRMCLLVGAKPARGWKKVMSPDFGGYVAVCKNGHTIKRSRKPRGLSSCGLCSTRFDMDNVLKFEKV